MRLTKQTSYAIRILIRCANTGDEYVKASDIAQLEGITRDNVLKVMSLLARTGFLTTNRGRTGGVKLARPAAKIDLADVFRITESTYGAEESGVGTARPLNGGTPTPVRILLDQAMQAFIGALEGHSLAELMDMRTRRIVPRPRNQSKDTMPV
jgi:Rrf2 family protein